MKMTRLIYPLIFAAALAVLSTGCKHKPTGLTPLRNPGETTPDITPNPLDKGIPVNPIQNPETNPNPNPYGPGNIPASPLGTFDNMNEDRQALASYTVHFKFDSAAILASEESNLEGVASALKANPAAKLRIEGNCDERGTEEYNRALGDHRALAAREALAKDGIDPERIQTQSFGKDKPADTGHDESAWAKNRRDEFVLLTPK
jgi:peptidoglycan-associated lipoprotein